MGKDQEFQAVQQNTKDADTQSIIITGIFEAQDRSQIIFHIL